MICFVTLKLVSFLFKNLEIELECLVDNSKDDKTCPEACLFAALAYYVLLKTTFMSPYGNSKGNSDLQTERKLR